MTGISVSKFIFLSELPSLGLHSFEFRRVLPAARQQWTLDSDSELDFDGFVTVEFGENGHLAANLAPETMWIDFFFFLTGSSDVNRVIPCQLNQWLPGVRLQYCPKNS